MSMHVFPGKVRVSVQGETTIADSLREEWWNELSDSREDTSDIALQCVEQNIAHKAARRFFRGYSVSRSEDRLIVETRHARVSLAGNAPLGMQQEILIHGKNLGKVEKAVIEVLIRIRAMKRAYTLVHMAGYVRAGKAVLMLGPGGAGKTDMILGKVLKDGVKILGDDRVWVNAEGHAAAFPRYIVIKSISPHAGLAEFHPWQIIFGKAVEKAMGFCKGWRTAERIVKIVSPSSRKVDARQYAAMNVDDMAMPVSELWVYQEEGGFVRWKAGKQQQLVNHIEAISEREWNSLLSDIARQHDGLFPEFAWMTELETVKANERRIWAQFAHAIP